MENTTERFMISYKGKNIIDLNVYYTISTTSRVKNNTTSYGILFSGITSESWYFYTEEERDKVFEEIKKLCTYEIEID